MKMKLRVLSVLLALLMLLPTGVLSVTAADADYATRDFESLTAGAAPALKDGFAALPATSLVRTETENNFLRIPFVGSYAKDATTKVETMSGNCDTALQINHAALNTGDGFTLEVDYRPHYNGEANAMVEAQFVSYTFTMANGTVKEDGGKSLSLFHINLKDGKLTGCGTVVRGAEGMKLDQWNNLKLTYHPESGRYEIYINGVLYASQKTPKMYDGKLSYMNCKDVRIGANQLIVAKCVKNADAYTATDAGDATNYIDVDNVRLYKSREAKVTLDGEETFVNLDVGIDLNDSAKKLLYAEVTHPGKSTFYTTDTTFPIENGTVINTRYVGLDAVKGKQTVRTAGGIGLRFLSALNIKDYDSIKKDEKIAKVQLGTVILPQDLIVGETLTAEQLKTVTHLDIPVTEGAWYTDRYKVTYCHTFAASIVNIKEENSNRTFVGVGYVKVTMKDGTVLTVFSENKKEKAASLIMSFAADSEIRNNTALNAGVRMELEKYAGVAALELKGLNVLAIGDSLFQGAQNNDGYNQWINMLGRRYEWNLTNLGIGGATISYNPNGTHPNVSMYNLLFNTPEKFKFGSTADDRYYNCGNPSGNAEDVDMILLQAGSNDYGPKVGAPLGTVGSTDPKEFLGAWKLVVDKLLVEYPNATVVMMTAWENNNQNREDGANAIEYTSSVVGLYEELYKENARVCLIDSGDPEVSGVNMRDSAFKQQYAFDAFHLNDAGMSLMAEAMLPYLREVILERQKMQIGGMKYLDVLAIGDSLFGGHDLADGAQWLEILAQRCSWNLTNLGANGWTLAKNDEVYPEGTKVRSSMYDKLMNDANYKFGTTSNFYKYGNFEGKTAADVDLIFLEGGWNDFNYNIPLGTTSDTVGSTYMGAVNAMVKKLLEQYPNATVVLITSWHTGGTRADGAQRMDFVANGMKNVYSANYADNDRVRLIDAGDPEVSGIHMTDSVWSAKYAIDAAHLNADGMVVMADSMQTLIWKQALSKE